MHAPVDTSSRSSMIATRIYLSWLRQQVRRFVANTARSREIQHRSLLRKIARHASSDFGRDFGFAHIRTAADFRRRVPVLTYEDLHPYMKRVLNGDVGALFAPGTRVLMFAMTSGTTGEAKRLPITEELFREYRRGWRLWGGGAYGDHPELLDKKTVQLVADWRQQLAPCGIPCGQISGLAAMTRPRVASQMFLLSPYVAGIHDPDAKIYTSLRLSLASRDVGMIITANPSTLVEYARFADRHRESLVRDIHDGTLSRDLPRSLRTVLKRDLSRRAPKRARELERLIERHGALVPQHAWPELTVVAVWMGGSVGVFRPQLTDLYGETIVRDHGLSASEGRMTIPLADNTSTGLLDYYHHYFEFIPAEEYENRAPTVLEAHELEAGHDYYIVLTTSGGLYRYDIHDLVRCAGFRGQTPLLEFLNKGKHYSNVTGEKLSEYQAVCAVESSFRELTLPINTFTLAPVMENKPRYVLLVERSTLGGRPSELAKRVQANLESLNEEYAAKCASGRLLPVEVREVAPGMWTAVRQQRTGNRGNLEQYKHPCLVSDLNFAGRLTAKPDFAPHFPLVSWDGHSVVTH
jgi:hypothetical protein